MHPCMVLRGCCSPARGVRSVCSHADAYLGWASHLIYIEWSGSMSSACKGLHSGVKSRMLGRMRRHGAGKPTTQYRRPAWEI